MWLQSQSSLSLRSSKRVKAFEVTFEFLFTSVFSHSVRTLWTESKFRKKKNWVLCNEFVLISLLERSMVKVHRVFQSKCKVTRRPQKKNCLQHYQHICLLNFILRQNVCCSWVVIFRILNYYSMSNSQESRSNWFKQMFYNFHSIIE